MRAVAAGVALAFAFAAPVRAEPVATLVTTLGEIRIELLPEYAPETVRNFVGYVERGFYDGTIFHRVMPGFMIQGGGFTAELHHKPTGAPIVNEADNGLRNERGTVAMARTPAVDSATAQFFINLVDNPHLDHGARDFGYAVFGRVVRGLDVVDAIGAVETQPRKGHRHVPVEPVTIRSVRIEDGSEPRETP